MRSDKLAAFESSQINTNLHNEVILIRAACLALSVGDGHIFQLLRNFRILMTFFSVMGRPQRIFSDDHETITTTQLVIYLMSMNFTLLPSMNFTLLPPASEGWVKVMFSVCSHLGNVPPPPPR